MTHDVIRHLLDDYVTGDLPEDARAPVADHVATCAACSAEVDSLRRILARASELPAAIEPPAEAWSNIREAILRDEKAVATPIDRVAMFRRRPMVMGAAAAILVAVLSSTVTAIGAWYQNMKNRFATPAA